MPRPKTYRFSELWEENAEDRASGEARHGGAQRLSADRPRPGRPPGARFAARCASALRRLRKRLARGDTPAQIAADLGIPEQIVVDWVLDVERLV